MRCSNTAYSLALFFYTVTLKVGNRIPSNFAQSVSDQCLTMWHKIIHFASRICYEHTGAYRSWGLRVMTPWKYVGAVRVCFDTLMKMLFFHSKLLWYCKFHNINDEQLDTITSLILLMLTMLPSLRLIISKETVSSIQCHCCSTGLKLSWPKTKLQNVGAGDPSLTILIDHSSYAVLLTIDRLQLGWLTSGVNPGGWEVLTPWKYVGRVRVCFHPLKCHILSFKTVVV